MMKPVLYIPQKLSDWKVLEKLRQDPTVTVINEIRSQLNELFLIRHPETIIKGEDKDKQNNFIEIYTRVNHGLDGVGVWVWYPWNRHLVHVLPEKEYTELRTNRNRNLITEAEQQSFYNAHVGVAGLSVGNSVVASLLHTGGVKNLSIADYDKLSVSNLNRIRAGIDVIGLSKCEITSREVYGINPFTILTVFPEGITLENVDTFITKPKRLDLIIDEMDSLYLKVLLRVRARKRGIPVIMAADNGDGVVVDVERYDLDRFLPLMHGIVPEKTLLAITPEISRPVAARIIASWVKPENVADRMKESLMEIGKTLYTWPQIGNAAFMAGAILSYVARKIIIGDPISSGKIVINPDEFFVPGYSSRNAILQRKKKTDQFRTAIGCL